MIRKLLKNVSSLRLTVVVLTLLTILTFIMTMSQVELGIFEAKRRYFDVLWVMWPSSIGMIPVFPGGKLLGTVLFFNLLAAHITRFKWTRAKWGIGLTHIGLLFLIVGSGYSGLVSRESQMTILTGESKNYSESNQDVELAIIQELSPTMDRLVSVPQSLLKTGHELKNPAIPFTLRIVAAYPNSRLAMNAEVGKELPHATQGLGPTITAFPMPTVTRDDYRNLVSVIVEIVSPSGSHGRWLLSNGLGAEQSVEIGGKSYSLIVRPARYYVPFYLRLNKFTQEYYPDTSIPRRFASAVTIMDPKEPQSRDTTIFMNNPLRYQGQTFYQASFGKDGNSTVLQVVQNSGWLVPYISCAIISLGLVIHFIGSLGRFLRRRTTV